jgi:transcriptional regulator with XRE-family HTH domain
MDIRRLVKQRLKVIGRSQYWLAGEVGISKQAMSRFLKDKDANVSVRTLMDMLKVLRLEIRPKE